MPARRQASEMFCNSPARASIPNRALISFSWVLMVLSLWYEFQFLTKTEILPPESHGHPFLLTTSLGLRPRSVVSSQHPKVLHRGANCPLIFS
jgi:hypothetical protein